MSKFTWTELGIYRLFERLLTSIYTNVWFEGDDFSLWNMELLEWESYITTVMIFKFKSRVRLEIPATYNIVSLYMYDQVAQDFCLMHICDGKEVHLVRIYATLSVLMSIQYEKGTRAHKDMTRKTHICHWWRNVIIIRCLMLDKIWSETSHQPMVYGVIIAIS